MISLCPPAKATLTGTPGSWEESRAFLQIHIYLPASSPFRPPAKLHLLFPIFGPPGSLASSLVQTEQAFSHTGLQLSSCLFRD